MLPFSLSPDNDPRLNEIISEIKKANPDVIALQEIWLNSSVEKITRELSDYSFISGTKTFFNKINKGGLVTGIRGKKILATNHTFAPIGGSSWVENLGGKGYQILLLPKNVRFVNTHLYAPTNKAEENITKTQFRLLSDLLRKRGGILAGDLNIEESDFLRTNRLFQYNFTHKFTLSKTNRYANSMFNHTPVSKKVDYVVGTGGIDVTEKILTDVENSDHFGLTGKIHYD